MSAKLADLVALRSAADTRWSRADENQERVEAQLEAQGSLGCASGMADALCCLELDVARHQDRITRSAADFVRSDSFFDRDHRAGSCLHWPSAIAPAAA